MTLPTQVGATYALDFMAAAVSGQPTYSNLGTVSAGTLVGAGFTVPFSAVNAFGTQVYVAESFSFVNCLSVSRGVGLCRAKST